MSATPVRVVLDTNVVVALLVFVDPTLAVLRECWQRGEICALTSEETLAEFERVLRYPELHLDEGVAQSAARSYRDRCTMVFEESTVMSRLPACRDPDDQKFLLLAQRGGAQMLLTRDKALLSMKKRVPFPIAPPEQFSLLK